MGCVYYDGDYECVENARAWMSFTFGFRNVNGKNGEFWMERGELSPVQDYKTAQLEAIRNMIRYGVPKERILNDYSEEEYDEQC